MYQFWYLVQYAWFIMHNKHIAILKHLMVKPVMGCASANEAEDMSR